MYEELIRRLREEPLDSNKAALPIMDLCIDAATAIENLSHRLDMAQGERNAVTRHMIELEQDVCRLKSRLAAYEDTGLEPEEIYEVRFLIAAQRDPQKLARLRELVLADQDGRLVVLPSKTVWELTMDAGPDCDMKCPVDAFDEALGCDLCSKAKQFAYERPCTQELLKELGKTVFLTRQEAEEAEAAMAQEGGTDEDSGGM